MTYLTTNYQIAAGHDNAAGLALITSLSDSDGNAFAEPTALPNVGRGSLLTLIGGKSGYQGFGTMRLSSPMLYSQYLYLVNNFEGFVTVKIPYMSLTWSNFNAVLQLPAPEEMSYTTFAASDHTLDFTGPGFTAVEWRLTRLEAL